MHSDADVNASAAIGPASRGSRVPLLVAVVLIVAGTAAWCWQLRPPAHRLAVDPGVLTISADDDPSGRDRTRQVSVDLVNTGRSDIAIAAVHSTCDCTVAGPVPKQKFAPGERISLKLDVTLPYYGSQQTQVIVQTDPPSAQPAILVLQMHGRTVETPLVSDVPRPAQLIADRSGGMVEHRFEVETVEAIGSDPWLTGMTSDLAEARVELVDVRVTRENVDAQTLTRTYEFLLRVPAPADERSVLTFALREEGTRPSVGRPQPYSVRVSYIPPIRAVPEQLLLAIDDDTQFPVTGLVELVASDDHAAVAIAEVVTTSKGFIAEVVSDGAAAQAGAANEGPRRVAVRLEAPPVPPEAIDGPCEVLVRFDDPQRQQIRIPVTLVDRRSVVSATAGDR